MDPAARANKAAGSAASALTPTIATTPMPPLLFTFSGSDYLVLLESLVLRIRYSYVLELNFGASKYDLLLGL